VGGQRSAEIIPKPHTDPGWESRGASVLVWRTPTLASLDDIEPADAV
jgi:hypothetical protein